MGNLVIVKCGTTMPALAAQVGDFEDWIVATLGHRSQDAVIWDARSDPNPPHADAIIITGSHDPLTDETPWMARTTAWVKDIIDAGIPTLGICFGHQMIAAALGGTVGENPRGAEVGTTNIRLTSAARRDALFSGLTDELRVHTAHYHTILELPEGVTVLAENAMDPYHAVRYRDNVWGVQFHPEMRPEIAAAYKQELRHMLPRRLSGNGRLMNMFQQLDEGVVVLQRFATLA
ncbi:MAG: glutamine amidotransferase [Chloroflexota bacterium]